MSTFAEIAWSRCGDQRVGLRFEDRSWTWAQVVAEGARRAGLLRRLGVRHVGLLLENVPDYVFWIVGAALEGAVVVGINPTRRGAGLARDIRHTDCEVVITEQRLAGLLDGLDHGAAVLDVDSDEYRPLLGEETMPEGLPDPDRTLLLLFSSGSTGAPKAVKCSQGRLGALAESLGERTELTRDSVSYLCMPLFHGNSAMMNLAPAMHVGSTVCLARKFSASGFARDVHRHGVTFVNYVGRALSYVLAQPEGAADRASTLRLAVGTEASPVDAERFAERFGCRVSEGYGMSEGVLRINRTADSPPDSLGLPVGGADVRVLREDTAAECPPAEFDEHGRLCNSAEAIGQIVALGKASAFEGYYNNPEAQAERVRGADFWTGDLAYRDADGYFYFAGRTADWIRVDGENFAAASLERIIQRWEPVEAVAVYPVADPRSGDQVMAALQIRGEFDPEVFANFLTAQPDLGTKWLPRFVRITPELPTTASNKTAKSPLRRSAWRTHDPIYHRPTQHPTYSLFTPHAREHWERDFTTHDRTSLLPPDLGISQF
ncbi:AMP-binding protein [Saccharopolyspora dendranthemae]|uniref:Fatty-acyl-CoA synthase n=1 Tax=Saccharopolyspora dendranthemae TaxID=1181886 RepID=A0A561V8C1_9PSEU|nr:AMP-binding protein [Saccharopolyspora dendranthemae]TWG07854.1 fatty-acyl-CoA synthase [Saccharopolyspora dendranthemae]